MDVQLATSGAGPHGAMTPPSEIDYTKLIREFVGENKMLYVLYISVLLVFPAEALVFPHVFSHAMAKVQQSKSPSMRDLSRVAALWIGVQALYLVMHAIDLKMVPKFDAFARGRVVKDIVTGFEEHYTEPSTGALMSSVLKLPEAAKDLFYELHHAVFADAVLIVSTIGYFFYIHKYVGLVFLVGIIAWAIVTIAFHKSCSVKTYAKERSHDDMHDKIEEIVSNLVTIFVHDTGAQELRKLSNDSEDYAKLLKGSLGCAFNFRVMYAVVVVGIFLAIMATSVSLVRAGKMKQANFVAVFIVTFTTMGRLMAGYTSIKAMQHSLGIVKSTSTSINETLNSDREIPAPVPPTKKFELTNIEVVNLFYKTGDGRVILDDINCTFAKGRWSALKGSSGSGKSSLIRLITRLDRPSSGEIKSNGLSIYDMSLHDFRAQVSYIPQMPKLLNRSLRDNLTYGGGVPEAEKIITILRSHDMHDIAKIFEERLDDSCGKGGSKFSGGQRSIIAMARAVLSDAKLIVLDEITAALDQESRDLVIKFMEKVLRGRTIIMITHDPALIAQADDVFEMVKGKVHTQQKTRW
jgi:ABC-type multidrug transport system fused ATPase/permease subunit